MKTLFLISPCFCPSLLLHPLSQILELHLLFYLVCFQASSHRLVLIHLCLVPKYTITFSFCPYLKTSLQPLPLPQHITQISLLFLSLLFLLHLIILDQFYHLPKLPNNLLPLLLILIQNLVNHSLPYMPLFNLHIQCKPDQNLVFINQQMFLLL